MVNTADIINTIEAIAPLETAEEWDNSGWQINLHNDKTNKILSCLSVTEDVLELAVQLGCDMIIAHHPLIFAPLKKLQNPILIKAIQNNIQIYSAHTNFDKANGGTTDILAQKLQLQNLTKTHDYVRSGELPFEMSLDKFIGVVKTTFSLDKIKLINRSLKPVIKTVALCAGAGSDFIKELRDIDLYITSDIKYHAALDVKDMVLLDIGHFESEKYFAETIKEILEKKGMEVIVANEKPAWIFV